MRRYFILPLLLLSTACANDKYPYAPQFVSINEIGVTALPTPPAQGSPTYKKEISEVLATQAKLNEQTKIQIQAEDHISPEMIVTPVLGKAINETTHPALFKLLRHTASDAWRIADTIQEHYNRMRPWLTDSRVQLLVSPIKRPSYPSGHSTTNYVWAHVLSELYPSQREALFAHAYAIGMHRVAAGVHHASDVTAGKKIAATIFNKMEHNMQFQRELKAAREEQKHPIAANDNIVPPDDCKAYSMTICK